MLSEEQRYIAIMLYLVWKTQHLFRPARRRQKLMTNSHGWTIYISFFESLTSSSNAHLSYPGIGLSPKVWAKSLRSPLWILKVHFCSLSEVALASLKLLGAYMLWLSHYVYIVLDDNRYHRSFKKVSMNKKIDRLIDK